MDAMSPFGGNGRIPFMAGSTPVALEVVLRAKEGPAANHSQGSRSKADYPLP